MTNLYTPLYQFPCKQRPLSFTHFLQCHHKTNDITPTTPFHFSPRRVGHKTTNKEKTTNNTHSKTERRQTKQPPFHLNIQNNEAPFTYQRYQPTRQPIIQVQHETWMAKGRERVHQRSMWMCQCKLRLSRKFLHRLQWKDTPNQLLRQWSDWFNSRRRREPSRKYRA